MPFPNRGNSAHHEYQKVPFSCMTAIVNKSNQVEQHLNLDAAPQGIANQKETKPELINIVS